MLLLHHFCLTTSNYITSKGSSDIQLIPKTFLSDSEFSLFLFKAFPAFIITVVRITVMTTSALCPKLHVLVRLLISCTSVLKLLSNPVAENKIFLSYLMILSLHLLSFSSTTIVNAFFFPKDLSLHTIILKAFKTQLLNSEA